MGDVAALGAMRTDIGGPAVAWPRVRGARRCLFGPPDPEKTRTFLESETKRLNGESRARWNFDFEEGKPLDCGRFVWTPTAGENECDDANNGKEKLQTRITDFMRKRKLPTRSNPKEPTSSPEEEPRTKTRRRFST